MTNKGRLSSRLLTGAALLALAAMDPAIALAQSTSATLPQSAALDEIVVTARKRDEGLTDVPVSITALTSEAIEARGVTSFSDLQNFTPGFRYQETGSGGGTRAFNVFLTRGIFPGSDSPDRQAVSIFIDGVPVGGGGAVPGLNDVSQVEVVNGPQSAYFGRSTFAGAVNFITERPDLLEYKAGVSASVSSYNSHEVKAQIEGPIIKDKLAARIAVRDYKEGAQYTSFGYGQKLGERTTKSIAGSLLATPTDHIRLRAYGTKWEDEDGPSAYGLLLQGDYNCNAGAGVGGALNYVCGELSSVPLKNVSQPPLSDADLTTLRSLNGLLGPDFLDHMGMRRKAYFGYISAEIDLPYGMTLTANGSQSQNEWTHITDLANRYSAAGTYSTFLSVYDIENETAEIRLASDSSKNFKFLFGANSYNQSVQFNASSVRLNLTRPGAAPTRTTTDTTGFFGALSYTLFDKLTLSAEGRYQIDKITSASVRTGSSVAKGTTRSFTPRVIAKYDFLPNANVYASYSEGTRPAQFNANVYALSPADFASVQAQVAVPLKVDEETLKMYEVGVKGTFFDNRLQLLAAAYSGKWIDKQVSITIFYGQQLQLPVVLPNGAVDLKGVELQAQFRPIRPLTLEGTFAYAETEIKNTTCTECGSITGNRNPVGNRLPRYPAYSGAFAATYEWDVFGDYTGFVRGDFVYVGKMYDTEANVAWTAPAKRVNLRFGVRNERYSAEIFGRNIFDDKTPTSIARSADQYNNTNTVGLGVPVRATWGVRVGANF